MNNMEMVMDSVNSLRIGEIARCFLLYNREQNILYTLNTEEDEDLSKVPMNPGTVCVGELYEGYTEDDINEMAVSALKEIDYLDYLASQFAEESSDKASNAATNIVFSVRYDRAIEDLDEVKIPHSMEMVTKGGENLHITFSDVHKYMSEENAVVFVADISQRKINESVLHSIGKVKKLHIAANPDYCPVPTAILGILFLMEDEDIFRIPSRAICSI